MGLKKTSNLDEPRIAPPDNSDPDRIPAMKRGKSACAVLNRRAGFS